MVVAPHTLIQPRKDLPNGKKGPSQVKMYLTMSLITARSSLLPGSENSRRKKDARGATTPVTMVEMIRME